LTRARIVAVAVAAALLVLFTFVSGPLPRFEARADAIVSMAAGMAVLAVIVWGLLPLRRLGARLLIVAAVALAVALAATYLHATAVMDLAKIAVGAAVGFWLGTTLAELTEDVRWIVGIAVAVAVADAFSVFSPVGVTHYLLTKQPATVPYFVVAFPTIGYAVRDAYSALGTADVIFFGLYLAAAAAFRLRVGATAAAMAASVVVTSAVAVWWRALPALPLMGIAFLAANADLLWPLLRGPGRGVNSA
jgi:hypothetical protein